jgi:hypothetical protein
VRNIKAAQAWLPSKHTPKTAFFAYSLCRDTYLPQTKAKEGYSCNAFAACCWLSKHFSQEYFLKITAAMRAVSISNAIHHLSSAPIYQVLPISSLQARLLASKIGCTIGCTIGFLLHDWLLRIGSRHFFFGECASCFIA